VKETSSYPALNQDWASLSKRSSWTTWDKRKWMRSSWKRKQPSKRTDKINVMLKKSVNIKSTWKKKRDKLSWTSYSNSKLNTSMTLTWSWMSNLITPKRKLTDLGWSRKKDLLYQWNVSLILSEDSKTLIKTKTLKNKDLKEKFNNN
jgi:hypothetical protein